MNPRDLFAAHAMRLIGGAFVQEALDGHPDPKINYHDLASWSFDLADAMMEERHRRKQPKADEAE